MRISPIKTIIRNLTDQKFTTPINSGLRIVVTAKNTPGDTAKIVGDVFTLMDRTDVVEALAAAVLDGKVSLEYVIDTIATVTDNKETPNINSSVAMQERIKKYRKPVAIADSINTAGDVVPLAVEAADTAKVTDTPDVDQKPEIESAPAAAEPTEPAKESEPAPAKPQRKPRQIKVN